VYDYGWQSNIHDGFPQGAIVPSFKFLVVTGGFNGNS